MDTSGKFALCRRYLLFYIFVFSFAGRNQRLATTVFIALFDSLLPITLPLIPNAMLSGILGACMIAAASGILFYVDSSSGGTDIIALIIKKFHEMDIGRAMLITDVLIVIVGGILSGWWIAVCSVVGLLIKTFGSDLVMTYPHRVLRNSKFPVDKSKIT